MEKTPSTDALKEWKTVQTREQALRWHLKWTPWFSGTECAQIVNLYDENKFRTEISIDKMSDSFNKLILADKIERSKLIIK